MDPIDAISRKEFYSKKTYTLLYCLKRDQRFQVFNTNKNNDIKVSC